MINLKIIKIFFSTILLTALLYFLIIGNFKKRTDYNVEFTFLTSMNSISSSIQGIILETTDYDFNQKFLSFVTELDNLMRVSSLCNNDVNDTRNIITRVLNGKLLIQMIHEDAELILGCSQVIENEVAIFNTKLKDILFAFLTNGSHDFDIMSAIGTIGNSEKKKQFMKEKFNNKSQLRKTLLDHMERNGEDLTSGNYMEFYFLSELLSPEKRIDDSYYNIFIDEFDSIVFLKKTSEDNRVIKSNKRMLAINLLIICFTISLIVFNLKFVKRNYKKVANIF